MRRLRSVHPVLMIVGMLSAGAPVGAASILGNLPPASDGAQANIGQGLTATETFTIGASPIALGDAIVRLTLQAPASDAPLLQILDSSGAVVETFTTPSNLPVGTSSITFLPSTAFTFQANTTYSLFLTSSNPAGALFDWMGSFPGVTPTGTGATFVSSSASSGSQSPLSFQLDDAGVSVTAAVPEPASMVMCCLGGLTLLGYFRARRAFASR